MRHKYTCFNDRCSLCVITPLAPALAVLKATLEGPIIILIKNWSFTRFDLTIFYFQTGL